MIVHTVLFWQRLGRTFRNIVRQASATWFAVVPGPATSPVPRAGRSLAAALAAVVLLAHSPAGWAATSSGLPWKSGSFVGPTNDELTAGNNPSPRTLLARIAAFKVGH